MHEPCTWIHYVWWRKYKKQGNKTYRGSPYLCLKVFLDESVGGDGTTTKGGGAVRSLPGQLCKQHTTQGISAGGHTVKSLEFVEAQFFMDFLGINITSYGNMVSKCETQSLKNLSPKYDICGFPTYLSLSQELLRYHQNVKHSPYELIHEIFTFLLNN